MKKSELLKLIEGVQDEQDIDSIVKKSELGKTLQSLEEFKVLIKNDKSFKSFIESESDKHHNKALQTWKTNNLEKELEPFIAEKYPDLVTDPVQKRLLELERQLDTERKSNARKDLLSQSINYANEKKIDSSFHYLIDHLLNEDLESTKVNIDSFNDAINQGLEKMVSERIKGVNYTPGGGSTPGGDSNDGSLGSRLAKQSSSINTNNNYFGGAK